MLNQLGVKRCKECPLWTNMAFGPLESKGSGKKIAIVMDFPREYDSSIDELGADYTGKLLNKIITASGLTDWYLTSLVRCWPKDNKIRVANVKACVKHLDYELQNNQTLQIIALGDKLSSYITKHSKIKTAMYVTSSLYEVYRGGDKWFDNIVEDFTYIRKSVLGI